VTGHADWPLGVAHFVDLARVPHSDVGRDGLHGLSVGAIEDFLAGDNCVYLIYRHRVAGEPWQQAREVVRFTYTQTRFGGRRRRESEEQAKRDALAAVLANKALTDRAAKLDQDAETVRAKLGKAPPVEKANPLGETLELLLGAAAAALTAWQQAVVAAVFELCLVGVMVIFELLGQAAGGRVTNRQKTDLDDRQPDSEPTPAQAVMKPFSSSTGRSRSKPAPALASVIAFIGERIAPADGERVEMKALVQEYRAWCAGKAKCEPLLEKL
jgi:hypothetical protein